MTHGSLFSGIGGFDLAAEWMGWENIFHCEKAEFPRAVLKKNLPNTITYEDIKHTDFSIHRGSIDLLSGGFPCQPYSVAGNQKGDQDDRHLWPEMLRAIREIKPKYVVGENVRGIISWNKGMVFDQVQTDMETEGYKVLPFLLPACGVNAWHQRYRVWFVANRDDSSNSDISTGNARKSKKKRVQQQNQVQQSVKSNHLRIDSNHWSERTEGSFEKTIPEFRGLQRSEDGGIYADIERRSDLSTPVLCGSYDGIPNGVDRVKAYGNAIVPQLAYQIFKAIEIIENQ